MTDILKDILEKIESGEVHEVSSTHSVDYDHEISRDVNGTKIPIFTGYTETITITVKG